MPAIRNAKTIAKRAIKADVEKDIKEPSCSYNPNIDDHGGRIPRPPNAFLMFRSKFWETEKAKPGHFERSHREISRMAGTTWKNLSKDEQRPYHEKARQIKEDHRRKYPNYIYNPRKVASMAKARPSARKVKPVETKEELTYPPSPRELYPPSPLQLTYPPSPLEATTQFSDRAPSYDAPSSIVSDEATSSLRTPSPPQTPTPSTYYSSHIYPPPPEPEWFVTEDIPQLDLHNDTRQGCNYHVAQMPRKLNDLQSQSMVPRMAGAFKPTLPTTVHDVLFCAPPSLYDEDLFFSYPPLLHTPELNLPNMADARHYPSSLKDLFDFHSFPSSLNT